MADAPAEDESQVSGVPLVIEDGVYLDLPENDYHDATALGSGDIRRLAVSPPDFWFNSKMNPLWEPDNDQTPAKKIGTATHVMVLYGADEFNRRYAPTDHPGNRREGIDEVKRILAAGKTPIKRDDWTRIHMAGSIVRGNPELAKAFSGGAASEVSVFWTGASGIQKKCRIDYLKLRASVDLKTIANKHEGMDFVTACRHSIATYNYPVQGEHYREGREQMARLIKAGKLFYRSEPDDGLVKAANAKEFAFVIVFVQKTGAPLTWGCTLSRGNTVLDLARKTIERAEENWRFYMERFGRDVPWLLEEKLDELAVEELPAWWAR